MGYERLRVSVDDDIGWLEFAHPPINAFDLEMLCETPEGLRDLLGRREVRVVVVASALEVPDCHDVAACPRTSSPKVSSNVVEPAFGAT